jgi:succinoglycan biosynthesis transport protein ExoP
MWKAYNAGRGSLDDPPADVERPAPTATQGLVDIRAGWLALRRHARLIAAAMVLALLATAVALLVIAPRYSATTILLVDPRQPRVTSSESVLAGIGADAAAVESQVDLITSPALARRVIEQLKLQDDPEFAGKGLLVRLGLQSAPDAQTQLSLVEREFQQKLFVRRRGLTYIIEVTFTSKDPAKAARIANVIAATYLDDQLAAKLAATMKASEWLNARIEEMRARVTAAERAVATYKAEHNVVDTGQGIGLIERQIETLNQQLILARGAAAEARARLAQVQDVASRAADPATLNEALQSPVIANLRAQYAMVARNEAELTATLGDHHPSLVRLRAQMADLRRQLDAEIKRILAGVRNEYEVATSREKSLENDLGKLKEQAAKIGQADVELAALQREAQANRALFDQFLLRSKETSAQQSFQAPDAQVVSAAMAPVRPNRPPLVLLFGLAGAFGVVFGIGLALVREQLDRSYRTVAQIERDLSLPCLGIVPAFAKTRGAGGDLFRVVVDRAGSPLAESLHAVRQRLRLKRRQGVGEIMMVVSAVPGEGKSVIAGNLAHAAAMAGYRTLLIDLDLRSGSLSAAVGSARIGLIDVLRGKAVLRDALIEDPRSGLSFLTTGDRQEVFAALRDIDDARLAATLNQCRQMFDFIVLDSAAILRAPETSELVEYVDRAILVVEWRRTERDTLFAALETLGASVKKIAGVVLNKVDLGHYHLYDYGPSRRFALLPAAERSGAGPALPSPRAIRQIAAG